MHWIYKYLPAFPHYPTATVQEALSIAAIERHLVFNKDGSIALGFRLSLPEEERLDPEQQHTLIQDISAAIKALPIGTACTKIDAFLLDPFNYPTTKQLPFFQRISRKHFHKRPCLQQRSFLFLRFFNPPLLPTSSFLALGNRLFKHPFLDIHKRIEPLKAATRAFLAAMPPCVTLERLSSKALETLLYQYMGLAFHRQPQGFEADIQLSQRGLFLQQHLEALHLRASSDKISPSIPSKGIHLPFTASIAHLAPFPHLNIQHFTRIDPERSRQQKAWAFDMAAQLTLQHSLRARALARVQQLEDLEKTLDQHQADLITMDMKLFVWHPDTEVVQERLEHLHSAAASLGLHMAALGYETLPAFLTHAPGATGFSEGLLLPVETAVMHGAWVSPRHGDPQGMLLQNRHGTPVFYDPFKYALDNQHAFVFGPSGSGKSFLNGKMIMERFFLGHTVVVLDAGGTYRRLFHALGGTYREYNPQRPLKLNPFLVPLLKGRYQPSPERVAFLVSFLAKIWKGDLKRDPLLEIEYAWLAQWITDYYKDLQPQDTPLLTGFWLWLKAHVNTKTVQGIDLNSFLMVLTPFTEGIYKDHFNAIAAEPLTQCRLLCFELEAVKADQKLYPLVMQVLFDFVLQLTEAQPTQKKFIDIEEGWAMLDHAASLYIEAFFRKGRKTGTSIRIITQNVDEIRESTMARALRNNAATFILLRSDKASVREEVAAFLGMNAFDAAKYAALSRQERYIGGFREVLIKEMDRSAVWRVGLSLYEHALLTSRPDERAQIEACIREEGGSIERGITRWVVHIERSERRRHGGAH